jgi:hypothetical protein
MPTRRTGMGWPKPSQNRKLDSVELTMAMIHLDLET